MYDSFDLSVHFKDRSNIICSSVGDIVRFRVSEVVNSSFGKIVTLEPFYSERDLFK